MAEHLYFCCYTRAAFDASQPTTMKRVLVVLGGSGFVGAEVVRYALAKEALLLHGSKKFLSKKEGKDEFRVIAVSRRGVPSSPSAPGGDLIDHPSVKWVKADATKPDALESVLRDADVLSGNASLVGVVHTMGVLFDSTTYGAGSLNRFISQSESVPFKDDGTYERINRDTALYAIDALSKHDACAGAPFVYLSAAEAMWPEVWGGAFIEKHFAPCFLKRYLAAKRQVEKALRDAAPSGVIRPAVLRPSLIYDTSNTQMLGFAPLWGAFYALNAIGLPFVDRPTSLATVASAAVEMVATPNDSGEVAILNYAKMDQAAHRLDNSHPSGEPGTHFAY